MSLGDLKIGLQSLNKKRYEMKITVDLNLNKEEIYNAGKDAGLLASTLDGFAMAASKLTVEFDYNPETAEMLNETIK